MRPIVVDIEGKLLSGYILKDGGNYWLHVNGRLFYIEEAEGGRSGKKSVRTSDPGILLAPMPGKIINVAIKAGDRVRQGDVIVVMEAMKMEYSLKAEIDGTIQTLNCNVGEQVALGKILAKIETT